MAIERQKTRFSEINKMKKEPLTIEWEIYEKQDVEARLLEVYSLLLRNLDEYEINQKKVFEN